MFPSAHVINKSRGLTLQKQGCSHLRGGSFPTTSIFHPRGFFPPYQGLNTTRSLVGYTTNATNGCRGRGVARWVELRISYPDDYGHLPRYPIVGAIMWGRWRLCFVGCVCPRQREQEVSTSCKPAASPRTTFNACVHDIEFSMITIHCKQVWDKSIYLSKRYTLLYTDSIYTPQQSPETDIDCMII